MEATATFVCHVINKNLFDRMVFITV